MRLLFIVILFLSACSTKKEKFKTENVCSSQAIRYLHNPRNKERSINPNPALYQELIHASRSMQLCYEDFRNRTGTEEFNTCLVVGVDREGKIDFYNFGTTEAQLDETFMRCAHAVTKSINYASFGKNYILIQSYQFYVGEN